MAAWVALLLLVVAGLVLMLRPDPGSLAGYDPSDFAVLTAGLALLVFIGSSLVGSYRGRAGEAMRDMLTWAVVALALVVGYSYRDQILTVGHDVLGELLPPGTALRADVKVEGERSAKFRRRADGTYVVPAEANGVSLKMLVDTGASWVVLTGEDGRRLGIGLGRPALHRAGADGQRHHLRGKHPSAHPDCGQDQHQQCGRAGGKARPSARELARVELPEPPQRL